MYAVIFTGGKQYKVEEDRTVKIEMLDIEQGVDVEFDKVLLIANDDDIKVGAPYIEGAKVSAEILSHGRHEKISVLKFRRRKHHMKHMGHRQYYSEIKINSIKVKED